MSALNNKFCELKLKNGQITKLDKDTAKALGLGKEDDGKEIKFTEFQSFLASFYPKKENKAMKLIYKDIRLSCFFMMYELSILLGENFESWNTDCIYYRDSFENRKLVHDFFDMHNMLYKQLTYNTIDSFKEFQD
jgi:hypothetical protein